MATVDFAALVGSLADRFRDRLANQIQRHVVLAQLLPIGATQGKNLQWVARTGTATGSVIADGADVVTFNNDDKIPAVLQFGTYHDAFEITGKIMAAAAAAGNPAELATLFVDELGDSVERLAKRLAIDTWTGSGATDTIHGLLATAGGLLDTGVYAGIDRAIVTQWQGNNLDNGGIPRALTLALMREMRTAIYNASGEKPDLVVCNPAQHEAYANLFGTERRYVDEVRMRGGVIRLDGGHQVLEFDGIPVVMDVDCPNGNMVFLNTRHVDLQQLASPSDRVNRGMGSLNLMGTGEEQFGEGRMKLQARLQPLAITGDAYKFALYCYPQVRVRRPNATGVIQDLIL